MLVDSLAMSMINGHEVSKQDFSMNLDEPGCFLNRDCLRKFITKLDEKLKTKTKYLSSVNYEVNFRGAISQQIASLVKAIEEEDYSLYNPIQIR